MVTVFNSGALEKKENLFRGFIAGFVASILCAVAFGAFMHTTRSLYYFIYIIIGFIIGRAMQHFGNGVTLKFSLVAVALFIFSFLLSTSVLIFLDFSSEGFSIAMIMRNFLDIFPSYIEFNLIRILLYVALGAFTAFTQSKVI